MSWEEALTELQDNAGTQFDPEVISALTKVLMELEPRLGPAAEIRALLSATGAPSARATS
jgi:HD-GYP domain-containing protein (c-di-GMP phosphodiesterase class II)